MPEPSLRGHTSRVLRARFGNAAAVCLAIMLVALGVSASHAQGVTGEAAWTFDAHLVIEHMDTADVNGDLVPDVIAGENDPNYYGEPSKVYAIDGANGDTLWMYTLQDAVRAMTVGDINDDGVADVLAGGSYNTNAGTPDGAVHAIDGATGLSLWTFPMNVAIQDIQIGDFNGDQYMDVAVASLADSIIAINGQTGGLLWATPMPSLWTNQVATGDVNGDHIDDVAFAHEYLTGFSNHVGVLDGSDGSVIWDSVVTRVNKSVKLVDFDGSGSLAMCIGAISADSTGSVHVRDAATGAPEWDYSLGTVEPVNGDVLLFIKDYDGDSDPDLLVSTNLGSFLIYAFNGDTNVPSLVSDTLHGYADDIDVGDVGGDGVRNIVVATYDRAQVLSAADGSLLWHYAVAGTVNQAKVADFDNDGKLEIFAAGGADFSGTPPDPGKAVWAIEPVPSPLLWQYQYGSYGNAIAVGDLNGDEFKDVAVVDSDHDRVTAIDGASGLILWQWESTANLYAITIGDFDGQGFEDVAVAGDDDQVTARRGTDGAFMWQFPDPTNQVYRACLASADVDQDGDVDVIAGSDDNNVYCINGSDGLELWSYNVGGQVGEIDTAGIPGGTGFYVAVAVEGGAATGHKVVLLDASDGSLEWDYTTAEAANYVEAFDANGDSVIDLAAGITPFTRQVQVIDGATQTILWSNPYAMASGGYGFAHADLDADGNQDLLIPGNSSNNTLYAVRGNTGDTLWTFTAGAELNCVKVADMDNDSIPDVILGGEDQTLYILNGATGQEWFSYATSGEIIDLAVGDIDGLNSPNVACATFDFDGIAYAFKSFFADTGFVSCCTTPTRGNVDGSLDGNVTLSDLSAMIDYLFISLAPLDCWEEGNVDASLPEGPGSVTLSDLSVLIDHLFISLNPLPACP